VPNAVATSTTNAIDTWVPVTMGAHQVQCNGWDAGGAVHKSTFISFTRTY
jgi:hypothetical protein